MKRATIIALVIIVLTIGSGIAGWFLRDYAEKPAPHNISISANTIADYIVTEHNAYATIQEAIRTVSANGTIRLLPGNYSLTLGEFAELNRQATLKGITILWNGVLEK